MNFLPFLCGIAVFAATCGIFKILGDLSDTKSSGAENRKIDLVSITALISLMISLVIWNIIALPLSFIFLNLSLLFLERKKRAKRTLTLNRKLSFVALSLSLLIDAGCSIQSAVAKLSSSFPAGPHTEFLEDMKNLFEIGVDVEKVKREISEHYRSGYADLLLESLLTGKALGSGPGRSLKQLSEKIFSDRVTLAEEKALKAPVKLMVPLCLFIFPAIFLLIFSPIILEIGRVFK